MKNYLPRLLPALALLTLGGCAGTSNLSTTENDGVYYSSQDRTIQNATASVADQGPVETQSADEISNPDYAAGQNRTSTVTETTEYYDEDYAYSSRIRRFHQPYYRGFGYGYNDFVFADPFWYGGPSYYGSAFYDPFFGPAYGFGGNFININIGFGRPWGYGYNPWRYGRGFGNGFYDSYYGGYGYGYRGFGGFGGNNYYNINNYYGGSNVGTTRAVRYGARSVRSTEAGTAGRAGTGNATGSRSRASTGGLVEPTGGRNSSGNIIDNTTPQSSGRGRSRVAAGGAVEGVTSGTRTEATQSGRVREISEVTDQQVITPENRARVNRSRTISEATNNGEITQPANSEIRSSRWRTAEATQAGSEAAPQPQYSQPRRTRSATIDAGQGSGTQTIEQPVRRERTVYEAPQRTYEAPQRTYEAPQRSEPSRSYEAPQRSSPEPSNSGGNSGGGRGRGRD